MGDKYTIKENASITEITPLGGDIYGVHDDGTRLGDVQIGDNNWFISGTPFHDVLGIQGYTIASVIDHFDFGVFKNGERLLDNNISAFTV